MFTNLKIGYAFCASFCTLERSFLEMCALKEQGADIFPIMSERARWTDSRFTKADEFALRVESKTGRKIISTVEDAEPLGPSTSLDALVIAPCTGNTLAKISLGISDGAVSVIVGAESLQAAEAAQILSIVYDTTGINPENVSIISKG